VVAEGARLAGSSSCFVRVIGWRSGARWSRSSTGAPSAEAVAYMRGEWEPEPIAAAGNGHRPPRLPGSGRSERSATRPPGARDCRRRASQSAPSRAPGTGKTMLARRLPGILPLLVDEEGARGNPYPLGRRAAPPERPLIEEPPFRSPHHSSSMPSIVGGGSGPSPGEASLAHRGVLLLDEFPEFQRPVLEALRQPLEDGVVSVARVHGRAVFPARFQLVADNESMPLRRARRSGRLLLLAGSIGALSRETFHARFSIASTSWWRCRAREPRSSTRAGRRDRQSCASGFQTARSILETKPPLPQQRGRARFSPRR